MGSWSTFEWPRYTDGRGGQEVSTVVQKLQATASALMTFLTSLRAHPLGRDNDVLITYLGIEVLSRMVIALSERVVAFFLEGVCQIGHY